MDGGVLRQTGKRQRQAYAGPPDRTQSPLGASDLLASCQGTEPADLSELLALVAQLKKDKSGLARKVWMLQRLVDAHNYMAMTDEMHFREPSKPFVHVSVDSLPEALFRNIEHVSGHLRRLYLEVYANARGETIYPWKTSHALFLYQDFIKDLRASVQAVDRDDDSSAEGLARMRALIVGQRKIVFTWANGRHAYMPATRLAIMQHNAQFSQDVVCDAHLAMLAAAKLSARQKEALVNAGKDYDSKMAEILQERRHTAGMLHQTMAAVEQPLADYGPSHADSLEKRLRHLRGAEDEAHASLLQAVLGSELLDAQQSARLQVASEDVLADFALLVHVLAGKASLNPATAPPRRPHNLLKGGPPAYSPLAGPCPKPVHVPASATVHPARNRSAPAQLTGSCSPSLPQRPHAGPSAAAQALTVPTPPGSSAPVSFLDRLPQVAPQPITGCLLASQLAGLGSGAMLRDVLAQRIPPASAPQARAELPSSHSPAPSQAPEACQPDRSPSTPADPPAESLADVLPDLRVDPAPAPAVTRTPSAPLPPTCPGDVALEAPPCHDSLQHCSSAPAMQVPIVQFEGFTLSPQEPAPGCAAAPCSARSPLSSSNAPKQVSSSCNTPLMPVTMTQKQYLASNPHSGAPPRIRLGEGTVSDLDLQMSDSAGSPELPACKLQHPLRWPPESSHALQGVTAGLGPGCSDDTTSSSQACNEAFWPDALPGALQPAPGPKHGTRGAAGVLSQPVAQGGTLEEDINAFFTQNRSSAGAMHDDAALASLWTDCSFNLTDDDIHLFEEMLD